MEKMMQATSAADINQQIKSANPELSKVLSEEPSSSVPKIGESRGVAFHPSLAIQSRY